MPKSLCAWRGREAAASPHLGGKICATPARTSTFFGDVPALRDNGKYPLLRTGDANAPRRIFIPPPISHCNKSFFAPVLIAVVRYFRLTLAFLSLLNISSQ
jgi:hypothetical protein